MRPLSKNGAMRRDAVDRRPGPWPVRAPHRLALALALALAAGTADAEAPKIYKWVDANGIAHYTTDPERIPKALRDRIQSVERATPEARAPNPAGARAPQDMTSPDEPRDPTSPPQPMTSPDEALADAEADVPVPGGEPPPGTPLGTVPPDEEEVVVPLGPPQPATTRGIAPAPSPTTTGIDPPRTATTRSGDDWFHRDARPRPRDPGLLARGQATPEQLDALAAEREALEARIAEVEAEIARDESFLKALISDPDLDADVPLFDRAEFLEVSQRLPELQARLEELQDERAKLDAP